MKLNFIQILGLIFIVLKLTNCIDWSWWLVLSPLIFYVICIYIKVAFQEAKKEEYRKLFGRDPK